jgi:hypothetical protein
MDHEPHGTAPSFWKSPLGVACTLVAIAASVYLYVQHQAHVYALLPYLFLAACPLMHMFMHRGHDHGRPRQQEHGGGSDEPRTHQGR